MAGAFQMLRSNDLVWSRAIRAYLLGERSTPNDLMSWNADATRMPYRMHSDYLRRLFLNDELAEGRLLRRGPAGRAVGYCVHPCSGRARCADHVAPWRSIYKIDLLDRR